MKKNNSWWHESIPVGTETWRDGDIIENYHAQKLHKKYSEEMPRCICGIFAIFRESPPAIEYVEESDDYEIEEESLKMSKSWRDQCSMTRIEFEVGNNHPYRPNEEYSSYKKQSIHRLCSMSFNECNSFSKKWEIYCWKYTEIYANRKKKKCKVS